MFHNFGNHKKYWKWIIGFNWLCCQFHYISIQNEKLMEINFHYKMTRLISMLNIVGMCNLHRRRVFISTDLRSHTKISRPCQHSQEYKNYQKVWTTSTLWLSSDSQGTSNSPLLYRLKIDLLDHPKYWEMPRRLLNGNATFVALRLTRLDRINLRRGKRLLFK